MPRTRDGDYGYRVYDREYRVRTSGEPFEPDYTQQQLALITQRREFVKSRRGIVIAKLTGIVAAIMLVSGSAGFGVYCFVSYLTTPTGPFTVGQSWHDGYADALSDAGYTSFPWGPNSCVNDWNGNGGYGIERGGYSSAGGPPFTRYLTLADQNTHSRMGNAWMAGCRAGLRSMGKGY